MQQPTHHDILRLFGDLGDHTIVEVLESGANMEALEEAAAWIAGENDALSDARFPLEGAAAQVYKIVIRDARFMPDE